MTWTDGHPPVLERLSGPLGTYSYGTYRRKIDQTEFFDAETKREKKNCADTVVLEFCLLSDVIVAEFIL